MVIPGFYLSLPHSLTVYAMFFCGLFLALVAEKYVFADAELKSQVIVGLILIAAAEFVSLSDQDFAEEMLVPAFLHQACQALPAWHQYELLLPSVGTGVELRNRIGFLAGEGLVSEGSWYGFGDLESCV